MNYSPLWKKVTSTCLLATLFTHISFPVYASVTQRVNLDSINDFLTASPRYELQKSVTDYLYSSKLTTDEIGIFDGFDYFYHRLAEKKPQLIPGYAKNNNEIVDTLPPRFGTAYVERGVIRHQITQILNKNWISSPEFSSYNAQTKQLYENAVNLALENNYQLGQVLNLDQIKRINKDVIWPEVRTLGDQQKPYLVPFVYLTDATIKQQKIIESTYHANSADIKTQTFIVDGVKVNFAHRAMIDVEKDFINTRGIINGSKLTIRTGRELQNNSGTITGDDVTLLANKLTNKTLVTRLDYGHGYSEKFAQIGTISSLGNLTIATASDVISHGGQFSAQGDLTINAGGNIILVPQQAKNERYESGARWQDSESSLVNLQTNLSAIDTLKLIAGGQIHIEGAQLESQGLIELLAGYGITLKSAADLRSFEKRFQASSGGVFGTKESKAESKTEAEIVRTLLKAGQSMLLSTKQGDILLEAVTIDNKGISKIIAENGAIDFELAKLLESYSYENSYEGSLSFRHTGNGYQREVAYYSEFINNGGLILDSSTGIRIQIAGDPNSLDSNILALAENPSLAWMLELRNDPKYQNVQWQDIDLVLKEWDYDNSGLSPAAMAILAVAVSFAVGPGGLSIAGTSGSVITASGAMASAINAGFASLVTQAGASLLANGFDVAATLKQMASDDSLKNLAVTMITAGVIDTLQSELFTAGTSAADTINNITGIDIATNSLWAQAAQQLVMATAGAGVNAIIKGHSWEQFGDQLVQNIAYSATAMLGRELANQISQAARPVGADGSRLLDAKGNPVPPNIDYATQLIAHAALGCGLGLANQAIGGGNREQNRQGCASGAAGGVIGEFVANKYKENLALLGDEAKEAAKGYINDLKVNDPTLSQEELEQRYVSELKALHHKGVDIAKLVAGVTVFAFGGDAQIAISTSGNAAENNALFVIPILIGAVKLVLFSLTVIDTIEAINKLIKVLNGDETLKPEEILYELALNIVGGKIKKAMKFDELGKLIQEALEHKYPQLAPAFAMVFDSFYVDAATSKVTINPSSNKKWVPKPPNMSEEVYLDYLKHINLVGNHKISPEKFAEYIKTKDYDLNTHHWVNKNTKYPRNTAKPLKSEYDSKFDGLNPEDKIVVKGRVLSVREAATERQRLLERSREAEVNPNVTKPTPSEINVYSEALGEARANKYAQDYQLGTKVKNRPEGSQRTNYTLDQIYVMKDGTVNILEAKGSVNESPNLSGHLVNGKMHMQGTREYMNSMLAHMEQTLDKLSLTDPYRETIKAVLAANEAGKLNYQIVVQVLSPDTGDLAKTLIKTYNMK